MIVGIGHDIIEIERINKACLRDGFIERYFTARERALFSQRHDNGQTIAGNFAAKEAIVKVFGTGFRHIKMNEIEILRDDLGKPLVSLYGEALELQQRLDIHQLHITISHNKTMASAVAIGEN